jgi:hypothetical protein
VWNEPNLLSIYRDLVSAETGDISRSADYAISERNICRLDDCARGILLEEIATRFPDYCSGDVIVLKEVTQSVAAPAALRLTPEARAVFLWRDPMDVLDSQIDAARTWRRAEDDREISSRDLARQLAYEVLASFNGSILALKAWVPEARICIRYEDLLENGEQEIHKLLTFCNIAHDSVEIKAALLANSFDRFVLTGRGMFRRYGRSGSWLLSSNCEEDWDYLVNLFSLIRAQLGYLHPG